MHDIQIKKGRYKRIYTLVIIILFIGMPVQVFPYFWMISNSFKESIESLKIPPTLIPEHFTLAGYEEVFKQSFGRYIFNTAIIIGGTLLVQITFSILAAYALSRLKPKFGKSILLIFVGTLMISGQALMFPTYLMMSDFPIFHFRLVNTYWSVILANSAYAYCLFLFKSFFDGLPEELMEAARMDGASNIYILTKIVLPLSKPVIAVNVLTTFNAMYNDFVFTLLLLPSDKLWTIMVKLYAYQGSIGAAPNSILAFTVLATIPGLVAYLLAQRNVVQGITLTGLKG
jgi:multiple sugar transport system permease protein